MLRTAVLALLVAGCATFSPVDRALLDQLEPELGQLLLVGFDGTEGAESPGLRALVCDTRVGGVLLSGRNVVDAAQVKRLTGWIGGEADGCGVSRPLVAVDAEGGGVMRLAPRAGYVPTPSANELGEEGDVTLTELEARRIGRMLREAGITWDLAPVVDVGYNPANSVIVGAGRSYGASPLQVAAHARAFMRGLRAEGLLNSLKHFPGHGSSFADSHAGFVDVTATAKPDLELLPYRLLLRERLVDSVMTAHVFNRRLDGRYPATLSQATITGLLRRDVGWEGVVVSDDLRMGAIEQHYGLAEAVVLALDAGVDVLLIVEDRLPDGRSAALVARTAIRHALAEGRLAYARVRDALAHVAALKRRARQLAY
jgi:beta-N-acetylhexosaminidase